MNNLAVVKRPDDIVVITDEQIDLIKKTVAQNASPQELQLYFYDCQRRGVHPLDKLIHFTKRGGKYTPIVSIDFMRSQAAETGECAGIDDAIFTGEPKTDSFAATITVYRIVKGMRCAFTATARWSEYNSDSSPMYKKMPHTMLAKCAESLALRKAFPQQIQGLYTKEEMEQANDDPPMRNVTPAQPQQQGRVLSLPPQATMTSAEDCEETGKESAPQQTLHDEIRALIQQLAALGHSSFAQGKDRQRRILSHIQRVAKDLNWDCEPLTITGANDLTPGELTDYRGVLTEELATYKKRIGDDPLM